MHIDTRWAKMRRDITGYGGRALALLVALSVGIFTVGAMLGAYGIVSREIAVNYLKTNPASATIEVDEVTPSVLEITRSFPGIAVAQPRAVVEARQRAPICHPARLYFPGYRTCQNGAHFSGGSKVFHKI
jgi:putative ABC transport system permease protein